MTKDRNLSEISEAGEHQLLLDRLIPLIDETIRKLAQTKFRLDPLGGRKYSRATSIVSSAYKRHGVLLGQAIIERLKECAHLRVWTESGFKLSTESDALFRQHDYIEKCLGFALPYGEAERTIPIDMMVYDKRSETLRSYNIKRGNGSYDAGKRRLITEELVRTHMLLKSYAQLHGLRPNSVGAHIIFYYGVISIPPPFSFAGDQMDEHFGFDVSAAVEAANEYFRRQLYELIESG